VESQERSDQEMVDVKETLFSREKKIDFHQSTDMREVTERQIKMILWM